MSGMLQGLREGWLAFTHRHDDRTVDGLPVVDWLREQEQSSRQQAEALRERARAPTMAPGQSFLTDHMRGNPERKDGRS